MERRQDLSLEAIAIFEALQGLAVVLGALGLLQLMHHNLHDLALSLIERFHLDPQSHWPRLLLENADIPFEVQHWWHRPTVLSAAGRKPNASTAQRLVNNFAA